MCACVRACMRGGWGTGVRGWFKRTLHVRNPSHGCGRPRVAVQLTIRLFLWLWHRIHTTGKRQTGGNAGGEHEMIQILQVKIAAAEEQQLCELRRVALPATVEVDSAIAHAAGLFIKQLFVEDGTSPHHACAPPLVLLLWNAFCRCTVGSSLLGVSLSNLADYFIFDSFLPVARVQGVAPSPSRIFTFHLGRAVCWSSPWNCGGGRY